jgi:FKBP-type peptidyl-prolyl cis-trans isomerase 2
MIENGTIVNVHYVGKFTDGTVFDSSEGDGVLRFEIGSGQIIPGFERALIGKQAGDKITVNIEPAQAYGEYNQELLVEVSKDRVPEDIQEGMQLQAMSPENENEVTTVVVSKVSEDKVVLDANHPLAGKELVFDIEVVSLG